MKIKLKDFKDGMEYVSADSLFMYALIDGAYYRKPVAGTYPHEQFFMTKDILELDFEPVTKQLIFKVTLTHILSDIDEIIYVAGVNVDWVHNFAESIVTKEYKIKVVSAENSLSTK